VGLLLHPVKPPELAVQRAAAKPWSRRLGHKLPRATLLQAEAVRFESVDIALRRRLAKG
jgi:hypothetical protein